MITAKAVETATNIHDRYIKCLSERRPFIKKSRASRRRSWCLKNSLTFETERMGIK
jgi:hypothetical protein